MDWDGPGPAVGGPEPARGVSGGETELPPEPLPAGSLPWVGPGKTAPPDDDGAVGASTYFEKTDSGSEPSDGPGPALGGPGPAAGGPGPAVVGPALAPHSPSSEDLEPHGYWIQRPPHLPPGAPLNSGGSEPAVGGSAAQEEAAPTATPAAATSTQNSEPADGGSEPADGGSGAEEDLSRAREFDRWGHRIRRDTTNMEPVPNTIYWNDTLMRYYNSQGEWCDQYGRLMPHRGQAGKYRSKGKKGTANRNPGGPGANPPQVHARFGERNRLPSAASASRSGSQRPPEAAEAARGDPGPARSGQRRPPWHRPARGGPSDWSDWSPGPARSGPSDSSQWRRHSTGPRQDSHRSRANRMD